MGMSKKQFFARRNLRMNPMGFWNSNLKCDPSINDVLIDEIAH